MEIKHYLQLGRSALFSSLFLDNYRNVVVRVVILSPPQAVVLVRTRVS